MEGISPFTVFAVFVIAAGLWLIRQIIAVNKEKPKNDAQ